MDLAFQLVLLLFFASDLESDGETDLLLIQTNLTSQMIQISLTFRLRQKKTNSVGARLNSHGLLFCSSFLVGQTALNKLCWVCSVSGADASTRALVRRRGKESSERKRQTHEKEKVVKLELCLCIWNWIYMRVVRLASRANRPN